MNEVLVVGSELVRYPYVAPPKSFDGNGTNTGNLLYSYHPNHLGSSSLIPNSLGAVTQHVEYVPFGEVFIEERNATWRTPYKFNGKELDEETGLYYYGARYYEPRTGLWLSVDPLAEKYPGVSSYVYCVNNPVMLVDPDGRKIVIGSFSGRVGAFFGYDTYEGKVMKHIKELKDIDPELNKVITDLENSSQEYKILHVTERVDNKKGNAYNTKKKVVYYDPNNEFRGKEKRDPRIALAHELGHAENDDKNRETQFDRDKFKAGDIGEMRKINKNEQRSIELENIVRKKLNVPVRSFDYIGISKKIKEK